ncbi:MAG: glycogen/starch/alpha-glucan phosphorylase [Pseudomonadota bacterium]
MGNDPNGQEENKGTRRRALGWKTTAMIENPEGVKRSFIRHIQSSIGRDEFSASIWEKYYAVCLSVRDELIKRWINTQQTYYQKDARRVYYLSMEYLMGRALNNALVNSGLANIFRTALKDFGYSLEEIEELGVDAGLGNGGLGRLAACFLDSMATLELPVVGYGLRYDYGIFRQNIVDGQQVEEPDDWLNLPNPWEMARPDYDVKVRFGGRVQIDTDGCGKLCNKWVDTHDVLATAYDTPIPGYGNNTVNTLRLWRAKGTQAFDLEDFNVGDYIGAVEHKVLSENITKILYPNDNIYTGKELRLQQEYFLVSATLQDAIRRHLVNHESLDDFADKVVFQLNDTHPAMAVVELMRLFFDEHGYDWDRAWEITRRCMAYTNHTLLPEALEKWPSDLMQKLFPRHMQLIDVINHHFLQDVRKRFPEDPDLCRRVSLYEEGSEKKVQMAHLAVVGSFSVNGVAELHTELIKEHVLRDFYRIWPEKFNNKTNGVTQRRWLLCCNPDLAGVITSRIGARWITDLEKLRGLNDLAEDEGLLQEISEAKSKAKIKLAKYLRGKYGFDLNPEWIFDVHVKRIHEYKRQLLNMLHIIHLFLEMRRNPDVLKNPRVFIFSGKAAPGYTMAKLTIRFINEVARRVNCDPIASTKIKVIFVPNYNVTRAEYIFPAADVSEQISTAGFEASGTGNMKFALNGAITVGTMDGANIEIAREVGAENIIIFGHTVDEIGRLRQTGYDPRWHYHNDARITEIIDLISGDFFSGNEPGLFQPIVDHLLYSDYYVSLADFDSYRRAHSEVDRAYSDKPKWRRMMLRNIANVGHFSSDRTIREYANDIWKVKPFPIELK